MLRYPKGCFNQYEVNIGYYPYRTNKATVLRSGPGDHFPVRLTVQGGQRFGWQSVRNPQFLTRPYQRGLTNGYAWGYLLHGGYSGWIPSWDIEPDNPSSAATGWADGPASIDFQVGYGKPKVKRPPRFTLGWKTSGKRAVKVNDLHIRYAAHGTSFGFLLQGDLVELRWRHPRGYACVKVLYSESVRRGAVGWVLMKGLRKL